MTPTSRFRHSAPSAARGFTLLELLLVLGIIALAAALIVPNLGGMEARSFAAQVRDLGAQLNYSRRNAVVLGQTATLLVATAEAGCDSDSTQPCWTAQGIELGFDAAAANSRSERGNVEPVDTVSIRFYPEGGSSGGRLALTQGEVRAWVDIDSFTGRVQTRNEEPR